MSFTTSLGYTPTYQIFYNGTDITGKFNDRVTSIKVQSKDGGGQGDVLDITLDDRDFLIEAPATDGSANIDLLLGYKEGALYEQGNFQINTVWYEGPPKSMRLRGTSQGFTNAAKSPLIMSHDGKTLGDIVDAIAQSAGVGSSISSDLASQKIQYLNQHSSSFHLLQELERRYNGLAKFENGMLSFTTRGSGISASGQFLGGFELTPEDFGTWSIKQEARTAYSNVRVSYWDKDQHQLAWLKNTIPAFGGGTVPYMVKRAMNTQEEAQKVADSKMDALNRGVETGSLTLAKGDPSIRGGSPFIISGMRDGINGSWVVTTATHTYTKSEGILTTLDFYNPGNDTGQIASQISNESQVDTSGVTPTTSSGSGGIGHM